MVKMNLCEVSTSQFAKIVGKTVRWVNELTRKGVLVQSTKGKYLLTENIQRYISYLQERVDDESKINFNHERALHERAKREKAELELAVIKNELHRADDIRDIMSDMLVAFRSKVLAMPSKLAPQLAGQTDIPVIMEAITKEAHEALSELSEYNPEDFQSDVVKADEEQI